MVRQGGGDTEKDNRIVGKRTGGCSSFSLPPRSGLAVKFEKTPSLWIPLPNTTRLEPTAAATAAAFAAATFNLVDPGGVLEPLEGVCCDELLLLPVGCIGSEFCLTSRCLSSGSSSESESSASKASARAGSLTRLFRGAAEEARE